MTHLSDHTAEDLLVNVGVSSDHIRLALFLLLGLVDLSRPDRLGIEVSVHLVGVVSSETVVSSL